MKKTDILTALRLLLAPVLVILLGLVLIFNPDSASALISKILGWGLLVCGIGCGLAALFSSGRKGGKVFSAIVFCCAGIFLVANPLLLAAWIGRFIGILLLINGLQDLILAWKQGVRVLMPLIISAIGAVLILMPMTTSRLVFTVCGVVVLLIGVAMLFDRLRSRKYLSGGDDPNIIDAL